ncbi:MULTISPECIES: heavy metal translocating P-type ATPase [unclassified Helicobacter]|uniref:heavy metal translocating P-type ATPase n=1 Tax=unclassified Helicobacter TaxID=2593540 RepID=UPI000CF022A2|nr:MULTISPECIES: heavy metal translocating P-type ATPase [unclassified Helicobacter]
MKKIYLKNVDCPSCASKIEDALRKIDAQVSLSFPSCVLSIHTDDLDAVYKIIKRIEPKVEIDEGLEETFSHQKIFLVLIGFAIALILQWNDLDKLSYFFLIFSYVFAVKPVILGSISSLKNRVFFDENTLMLSASIAAFFIQAFTEAVAIMVFYSLGEHLQSFAIYRSKKSFKMLINTMPDQISVEKDGIREIKNITEVQLGEVAIFNAGELIALDGEVLSGEGSLDVQAITGESLPVAVTKGDRVLSGSVVLDTSLKILITQTYENSFMLKMKTMLEQAIDKKTRAQSFITKFARFYTPIVFIFAVLVSIIPPFLGYGDFREWLYRALVVLMVSCPCALVLAIPLGYFSAIGCASKNGILIKSAEFLEKLNEISLIIFDKTGTLTTGKLEIKSLYPFETSQDELLESAYIGMQNSNHLIASSFKREKKEEILDSREFAGKGVMVKIKDAIIFAGNAKLMKEQGISYQEPRDTGIVVHIARNQKYLGYILLKEEMRQETSKAVEFLKALQKEIIIVSGDTIKNVQEIATQLGIKYYAQALPEDKYQILQSYQKKNPTMFVGDGINDAPSLALADIGVSMGIRGSDMSKQGSDILLLQDDLMGIPKIFKIARKTKAILWQNVILALGIKLVFIILGIFGIASIWEAVFGDVGVSLLALLNTFRIFKVN